MNKRVFSIVIAITLDEKYVIVEVSEEGVKVVEKERSELTGVNDVFTKFGRYTCRYESVATKKICSLDLLEFLTPDLMVVKDKSSVDVEPEFDYNGVSYTKARLTMTVNGYEGSFRDVKCNGFTVSPSDVRYPLFSEKFPGITLFRKKPVKYSNGQKFYNAYIEAYPEDYACYYIDLLEENYGYLFKPSDTTDTFDFT